MNMIIISFVLSFAIAAIAAPSIITALRKLKVGQKILEIGPKWHMNKQNIPTMGGFIFIGSSIVAAIVSIVFIPGKGKLLVATVFAMSAAFGAIGFLDDYKKVKKKQNMGLTAIQKLVLQIAVAIVFISIMRALGYVSPEIIIPFFNFTIEMPWIVYNIFMAFVIVGAVNAVNLTDGLDGLAAGVTSLVMIFFAAAAIFLSVGGNEDTQSSMKMLAAAAAAVAGGLGGFLIYNFNPAKVFMGDTGSLFLGACVAGMAFAINLPVILIPVGIVYIVETLSVMIQVTYFKISGGKRIFKMAPIHHHFEMCGYSEKQIVICAMLITLAFCILSYYGITLL